jgi:hypothetical protein
VLHREATLMLAGLKYYFHGEQARAEKWFAQLRDANADSPLIMSLSGSLCRAGGRAAARRSPTTTAPWRFSSMRRSFAPPSPITTACATLR